MTTSFAKAYDLAGQVAIMTGGAQGIGLAISSMLAAQGARVVIIDQNPEVGEIAEELGQGSYRPRRRCP